MKVLLSVASTIIVFLIASSELADLWKCVWSHTSGVVLILSYVAIDIYKGRLKFKDK